MLKTKNKYSILRKKINKKFGSLKRFSKISKISYFSTVRKLNEKDDDDFFEKINFLCEITDDDKSIGNILTDQMRDRLQIEIYKHPDSFVDGNPNPKITNFITKHPQFSKTYLSMIFSRKDFKIKKVTKKVKELSKILNINLNDYTSGI